MNANWASESIQILEIIGSFANKLKCFYLMRFQRYAFKVNPPYSVTESQNHRIVGVGRDHCGSSSPDQRDHHETPAQTHTGHLEK